MNPLSIFRRDHAADEETIARSLAEAMTIQPEQTLLEHNAANVERILARLRSDEAALEQIIAERQTRLDHTRTSIKAFDLALEVLKK